MTENKKGFLYLPFLVVFILILGIAQINRISLLVSVERALLSAAIFSAVIWLIGKIIRQYALPPQPADQETQLGQSIDFSITESSGEQIPDSSEGGSGQNPGGLEFAPLAAKQIDPNTAKIINTSPEQAAKIIEKMGFDQ